MNTNIQKTSIVITSISEPNAVLKSYARGCLEREFNFLVIGDVPSPKDFKLDGCNFFDLESQKKLKFNFASLAPLRHYSRKNIGYLLAFENKSDVIVETDDDNYPFSEFWIDRDPNPSSIHLKESGWTNIYKYFSDEPVIWARGFPLEKVLQSEPPSIANKEHRSDFSPIQQGLADQNPDVDAVYRLVKPLPLDFKKGPSISLGRNSWHPFNSQNTTWFKPAFPLLYLPSYCSFRMTDIWRSYVAQRIAWECGWSILYHSSTVYQERNEHSLIKDFEQEIPGYLQNLKIASGLEQLTLKNGVEYIFDNLILCYQYLIEKEFIDKNEMSLLSAWISDCKSFKFY